MPRRLLLLLLLPLAALAVGARGVAPPAPLARQAMGAGTPIVLVHGLGSPRRHWLPVARRLAEHHRVTLVDLPGHGGTEMPAPFSLEQCALALDRALREDHREPVVLVGHSLGGLVAAAEAIDHPERVRALVLVETSLRPQIEPEDHAALLETLERDYDTLLHAAYRGFARDSAQGEQLYREVAGLDAGMVERWIKLAWSVDLSAASAQLDVPVLAVLAPRSWELSEPWAHAAEALGLSDAPRVRPARIEGCGHFPMLDRPETLADLIHRFALQPEGETVALR